MPLIIELTIVAIIGIRVSTSIINLMCRVVLFNSVLAKKAARIVAMIGKRIIYTPAIFSPGQQESPHARKIERNNNQADSGPHTTPKRIAIIRFVLFLNTALE